MPIVVFWKSQYLDNNFSPSISASRCPDESVLHTSKISTYVGFATVPTKMPGMYLDPWSLHSLQELMWKQEIEWGGQWRKQIKFENLSVKLIFLILQSENVWFMGVIINKGLLKLRYMESLSETESNWSLLCSQKTALLEERTLSDYKGFDPVKEYLTQRNRSITSLLQVLEMAESTSATLGYICLCIVIQLQRVQVWTQRQRNKNKQWRWARWRASAAVSFTAVVCSHIVFWLTVCGKQFFLLGMGDGHY